MTKAVAYCRYSSELQRDGYSIEAQLHAIEEYCLKENITLVDKYIDEARSGTSDERESFQKMIRDSSLHNFELVIVHKLDRFARDRYDSAIYKKLLKDNGVRLVSVLEKLDDSPESIILESVLEGMNEYYSRNLSRETRKGLYARAREGKACGNVPLGLSTSSDGHFIIENSEVPLVKEIFSRAASGEKLGSIASDLNARHLRGKRQAKFSYHSLEKIIKNEIYIGRYIYSWGGGEPVVVDNVVDSIIDNATFALANSKLSDRKVSAYRRHRKEDYVLTGLLFCGKCGHHYCGHSCSYKRKGKVYTYSRYRCTGSAKYGCNAPVVDKVLLEAAVFKAIERDMLKPEIMKDLVCDINKQLAKRNKPDKKTLHELRAKKEKLLDLYLNNEIDKKTYLSRVSELDLGITHLEGEMRLEGGITPLKISAEYLVSAFKYYFERVKLSSVRDQMMILNHFVERIDIYEDHIKITYKIKNALGEPLTGSNERMCLNGTKRAYSTLLSTYYRVKSYSLKANSELFSSSDFMYYRLVKSETQQRV